MPLLRPSWVRAARNGPESGFYLGALKPYGGGAIVWHCNHFVEYPGHPGHERYAGHETAKEAHACAVAERDRREGCPECGRKDGHDLAIHSVIMRDALRRSYRK